MKKRYSSLEYIENDHKITYETDCDFLYHLKAGLLLALKEQGKLNAMQYQHAKNQLDHQRIHHANAWEKGAL